MNVPDRSKIRSAMGERYEVFNPPWWRLDRWLVWAFTKRPKALIGVQRLEGGPAGRRLVTKQVRVLGERVEVRPLPPTKTF